MNKLLEKSELEVVRADVKIGERYPIYGMITHFINEDNLDDLLVEVNFNMILSVAIKDSSKLNTLKERSLEPGIFLTTITEINETDNKIYGKCETIVFGKKNEKQVQ